jgi:hypothetical protein
MTEELVTLETAKMLIEKGFNECRNVVDISNMSNDDLPKRCFLQPTQSIAQKWLREVKNLHIEISYIHGNYWIYDILTIPEHDLVGLSDRPLLRYKTYEEALEAGIFEALKLI